MKKEASTYEYLTAAFAVPFAAAKQKDLLVTMGLTALVNLAERYNNHVERLAEVLASLEQGQLPEEVYPFLKQPCLDLIRSCDKDKVMPIANNAKILQLSTITAQKPAADNNKVRISISVPCVEKIIGRYQLKSIPYYKDETLMHLALPYINDVWMVQQDAQWQFTPAPRDCVHLGKSTSRVCLRQAQADPYNIFSVTGSNQHATVPAIELPWTSTQNDRKEEMDDNIFLQEAELIVAPRKPTIFEMNCGAIEGNGTALEVNASQIIEARIPQACTLKLKNTAGKVFREIAPTITSKLFGKGNLPQLMSFRGGTIKATSTVIAAQLMDTLASNLWDNWPHYTGIAAGIGGIMIIACSAMILCRRPVTLLPPHKRRKQRHRRPIYVRTTSPTPLGF
jgi:hypothetical protein